jgi:hypothetical protein
MVERLHSGSKAVPTACDTTSARMPFLFDGARRADRNDSNGFARAGRTGLMPRTIGDCESLGRDLGNRDVGWREHAVQRHQPLRSSVIGSISREDFALIAAQVKSPRGMGSHTRLKTLPLCGLTDAPLQ